MPTPQTAKRQRTQWAAQFLAASELVRRGYAVSFTMGNHTPMADLMVGNPDTGQQFWVDVKGLSAPNSFPIGNKKDLENLFYILVLVGKDRSQDQFFVMTQTDVKAEIKKYNDAHPNTMGPMPTRHQRCGNGENGKSQRS